MEKKTYYDWLEVSTHASSEVIEKAYKALVLKYHPDVQQEGENSGEIIKQINEAYSVLSDPEKRAQYDSTLKEDTISKEDYEKLQQEINNLQNEQSDYQTYTEQGPQENIDPQLQSELEQEYIQNVEAARRQAYRDAYIQEMKRRGYKIRYKKSFKDYLRIVITIVVIFVLIWLIWQIPFIRNWINDLAKDNFIIKIIVDFIKGIYEAIYETIFRK